MPTASLGLKKEPGLYDLLVREADFDEVIRRVPEDRYAIPDQAPKGEIYLVPSNTETRAIPLMTSDGLIIYKRFSQLKEIIDVVIFDTSPTPSLLHASIYMATHAIVYPTECEYLSLDGLVQSLSHKDMIQPTREQWGLAPIDVMGIVPMKYRGRTVLHNQNLESLRRRFGKAVWSPVALRAVWGEASLRRKTVFNVAPDSNAALEAWGVVKRVQEAI